MKSLRIAMAVLTICLLAGLMSLSASIGLATEPSVVPAMYIDAISMPHRLDNCALITSNTRKLTAGWYTIHDNVTLNDLLHVEGEVNIILTDARVLEANAGIEVQKDAKLTVYTTKDVIPGSLVVRNGLCVKEETPPQDANVTNESPESTPPEDSNAAAAQNPRQPQKSTLFAAVPCLEVIALDKQPEEIPEPERAEALKPLTAPTITNELLAKPYLRITPIAEHDLAQEEDHYACKRCGEWYAEPGGHVHVEKPQPAVAVDANGNPIPLDAYPQVGLEGTTAEDGSSLLAQSSEEDITITFDANGGSGSMAPKTVKAGEAFVLPECTFTAPEGQVFQMWSLGMPGTSVSVPRSTTVKAWWKTGSATSSTPTTPTTPTSTTNSTGGGTGADASGGGAATGTTSYYSSTDASQGGSASSQTAATPETGDGLVRAAAAGCACLLGALAVMAKAGHLRLRR